MAQGEQMLGGEPAGGHVVDGNRGAGVALGNTVDGDRGNAGVIEGGKAIEAVFGGDEEHAVHPAFAGDSDIAGLALDVVVRVIEHEAVALGVGKHLGSAGHRSE